MPTPAAPSRFTGVPGRALAALAAVAVVLTAGFVLAPATLAANSSSGGLADRRGLVDAVHRAFTEYWQSGDETYSPGLQRVVDYWFRYHLAKAAIAALLLIVLGALAVVLWKAFLRAGGLGPARRTALASAGAGVTMLALFSVALVMANVQGAVAPFASLLPMLVDAPRGASADTLAQVRQQLSDAPRADGRTSSAVPVMISDFARYHVALAVVAAIVAVVLIAMSVACWKRWASTGSSDRRTRRFWAAFGVVSAMSSLVVVLLVVANTTTAADPAPALAAFFDGGW